jgi:type 1 glutamine amidotransferase
MRPNASASDLAPSEKWMQKMAAKHGFDVVCTKEGNVFDGDLAQFDAFVFYTSGDLTKPIGNLKQEPASSPMTPEGKRRLLAAIEDGKGFVGLHSATDSFRTPADQVDPYIAMLGGEFLSHGAQQVATQRAVSPKFPGLEGLKDFALHEEWYSFIKIAKDLHVILVQETNGMKGWEYERPPFPATWARAEGKGRVFFTSLGHGEPMFAEPIFEKVVMAGMQWAGGNSTFEAKPNVSDVCPGAHESPKRPAGGEKKGKKK